jgi:hypothetical protein
MSEEKRKKNEFEPWMLAEARRAILKHIEKVKQDE